MDQLCRITDLRAKEVVNLHDGCRLGFVCDVEVDILTGTLRAIVVPGEGKLLGIFGHAEEVVIPWNQIKKIGDDIILVEHEWQRSQQSYTRRRL